LKNNNLWRKSNKNASKTQRQSFFPSIKLYLILIDFFIMIFIFDSDTSFCDDSIYSIPFEEVVLLSYEV